MKIELPRFSDYHVHFRDGDMLAEVAPASARYCGRVLLMPNLTPPVSGFATALAYHKRAKAHAPDVDILVTAKLLPTTTPEIVRGASLLPALTGFKLYPAGVTTHSADGVPGEVLMAPGEFTWLGDVLDAMQGQRQVLCLHGESPDRDDPFEREPAFFPFVDWVLDTFPRLRVVMEHITTGAAVGFVRERAGAGRRLAATITGHHLMIHFGHLCGSAASPGESRLAYGDGKLRPHLFCWPIAKRQADRAALVGAATSGEPCFFLGSDSAPHPVSAKEAACGCAGVYSAPVLPEALCQVFADRDAVDALPGFVAGWGDRFYDRKAVAGPPVRMVPAKWTVPHRVGSVVPFLAGRCLDWAMDA